MTIDFPFPILSSSERQRESTGEAVLRQARYVIYLLAVKTTTTPFGGADIVTYRRRKLAWDTLDIAKEEITDALLVAGMIKSRERVEICQRTRFDPKVELVLASSAEHP